MQKEKKNIEVDASPKAPYSMDANLLHISYEAGALEDPNLSPEEEMFSNDCFLRRRRQTLHLTLNSCSRMAYRLD